MTSFSMQEWQQKFGLDPTKVAQRGMAYEFGKAYQCKSTSAKIVSTPRGDIQLQVAISLLNLDGHTLGKDLLFLTLPCQASDDKIPEVSRMKITMRRRDDVQKLLSLADPQKYLGCASVARKGKRVVKLDEQGNKLSNSERTRREQEVNRLVMDWCEDHRQRLNTTIDELANLDFYIVKVENPNNDDFPFTNIYTIEPDSAKFPLYTGED